jgi:hypothetical protein
MRADQRMRAAINRVRRAVIGRVDHEPVVIVEGHGPAAAARVRGAAKRWLKTAAAFVATFAVFGLIYGASVAWRERVVLPLDPPGAATPESGSKAIAVAALLLSIERIDPAQEEWFTPQSRQRRAAQFQHGAAEAVSAFIEVVDRRRPGRDKDLTLALATLSGDGDLGPAARATARDALRRVNARIGHKGPPVDRGQRMIAALARAAAAGVGAQQRALAEAAKTGHVDAAAETAFYRARGYVYAWRLLIGAYSEDLDPRREARINGQVQAALAALAGPALFEPAVLMTPPLGKDGPIVELAARLDAALPPLRILAERADDDGLRDSGR